MRLLVTILFFYISLFSIWGITIPSSIQRLINGKDTKLQVKLLDSLAVEYRTKDFILATALSKLGLSIAKQNNFHSSTVKTYLTLSRTYRSKAHYDTALAYIDSARTLAFANNLHDKYGVIFDFEGLVYMRMGDYTKATEKFYASVKYSEQEKDSVKLRDAFDHLGSVNFYRHDFKSAIKFYKKALGYTSVSKNVFAYTSTLDNIGLGFTNLNIYDSALFYQKLAVTVFEKLKDSTLLAESYGNIGATYFHLEKFNEAERFFMKAFTIHHILRSDYGIQLANLNLGKLYLKIGNPEKALPYLETCYAICTKLKIPSQLKESLEFLTEANDKLGDYKRASILYKELLTLIDQLSKDENAKAINELSTKYETEKKQQEIQLLKQDKDLKNKIIEKDKYVKLFISVVAALLLILSAISIYRYKEKKKDNSLLSEKNAAIELQKKEIELQKEQIEQTNVQIVDSINYAYRIQNSVLPSMKLVKEKFPNSFVYFKPKDIVSGDFYWLVQTKNHLYFAVADCTGHGVPGAMMSMLGTSFLNQIVLSNKIELPSEILNELHLRVLETLNENMQRKESKDGMDIGLLRIDLKNKELQFAGAGRSLYTMCKGQLQTYKGDKQSIGSINNDDDFSYSLNKISFTEGMQLYLFTDGVPDQFGGTKGKKLMTKNLLEALIKMSHLSIDKQEATFKDLFENWKRGFEQTDDVTLVSIHLS